MAFSNLADSAFRSVDPCEYSVGEELFCRLVCVVNPFLSYCAPFVLKCRAVGILTGSLFFLLRSLFAKQLDFTG